LLSSLIALTALAGALTHFYLYGFFAILIIFFYVSYGINPKPIFRKNYGWAIHFFFQLILPYLILQAFYFSDHTSDRTSYPWGFLYYRAYPQTIFLPFNKPYGHFLHNLLNFSYIDWEGYAYVGLMAVAGTLFFIIKLSKKLFTKKYSLIWQVTPDFQLNILFWAAMAALLYSFGLPFILGLQFLVDLIGPVRQMRGIARFSWIFFYIMNIITVYWLWNYWKNAAKKIIPMALLIAALLILFYDAFYNVRNRGKSLENFIPDLVDRNLELPENQWIRRINTDDYQAMIPLPYFHIGSENIWIDNNCDIIPKSFIAIARSGLPSLGVSLSRTSLNQTIDNVALMLGPSSNSLNMERFPSQKPFLLLAARCDNLSNYEKQLIAHSTRIDSSGVFDIYELPFRAFQDIADSIAAVTNEEYRSLKLYDHNELKSTDSLLTFRFLNFDSLPNAAAYMGAGCFQGIAKKENVIFSGTMPRVDTAQHYSLSFWLNDVRKDLYPRTRLMLTETDPQGNIVFQESYQVSKLFQTIDGNWAFINLIFRLKAPENSIKVTIRNKTLRNKPVQVDNLMIRRQTTAVYQIEGQKLHKNNKFTAVIGFQTSLLR
jgi:hypothetical protein